MWPERRGHSIGKEGNPEWRFVAPRETVYRADRNDSAARRRPPGHSSCDAVRERRLLRAARRGDRGDRARLVTCHLGLVRSVAARYRDYGLPLEDLVQEGSIGLLEAIEHYEPSRSPQFVPYASFRIRRAIRNALTDQARLIRLPKQIVERRRAIERAEARLVATGRRPTPADLAAATGLSIAAVIEARTATQPSVSLDEPVLPDGSSLESIVADTAAMDPADETVERERVASLKEALAQLPPRQRQVVTAQWGLNGAGAASATAIADELELSPRRTQTIGQEALYELRQRLEQRCF
jgi:RNA polymerase primary sigma factor